MTNEEKAKLKQQLAQAIVNNDTDQIRRLKKILNGEIRILRTFLDFLKVTDAEGDSGDDTDHIVDQNGDFPQFLREIESNKKSITHE